MAMEEDFLTVNELSQLLKVKRSTLYAWVESSRIPHYRFGRIIRFEKREILGWIEEHRKHPVCHTPGISTLKKRKTVAPKDIDLIVKEALEPFTKLRYTRRQREPDLIKALGKEGKDGSI